MGNQVKMGNKHRSLQKLWRGWEATRGLLHKTMVTLQLVVSLQSMVTTIATLLHSQSKSRNQ